MADTTHFHPVSATATVQVLSQTQTADVERVRGYTKPSGVFLIINVPLAAYQAGDADAFLEPPAAIVEGLIGEGLVSDATQVEATGRNRLLADFLDLTVSYTPPGDDLLPFTSVVRIPMTALRSRATYTEYAATPPHVRPVATAYNRLVELAGGPDADKV